MPTAPLKLTHVSFGYHQHKVLDDVTLEVKRGDFVGLIGPNGSGKTTLLQIALGLLQPDDGEAELFGVTASKFKDWPKVGYVPQHAAFETRFPITAREVVAMAGGTAHEVEQALMSVNMHPHAEELLTELSGGQQQRVYIARALVSHPELLILDEPTVGVDTQTQESLYTLLRKLNREQGLTLVLVSHDVDVVAQEVTTVACLNSRIIFHGKPAQAHSAGMIKKLYGGLVRHVHHDHHD